MTHKKITLIGAGTVGTSFIYSSINQELANEYAIIDLNKNLVEGHILDLEDAIPNFETNVKIKLGTYNDLTNTDILVITAGRPQKQNETRLNMIADNAKIIKKIALEVKKQNYKGITIIASNPVDIMAAVFQKVTNFSPKKVISSGTWLDTLRLRTEIAKLFDTDTNMVDAYVLGEHGDSSVSTIEFGKVNGKKIINLIKSKNISDKKIKQICSFCSHKAYKIIDKKGSTYFGIGSSLAKISEAILKNKKTKLPVSTLLTGEYGQAGMYTSVLAIINKNGVVSTEEFPLSPAEQTKFIKSTKIILNATEEAFKAIR